LKNRTFKWDSEADQAFEQIKETISTPLVLALPDFNQSFIAEYDASGIGLEVVLMQVGKPISYFNKSLKGRELSLSTYKKEFLALVTAIQKWRPYLLGQAFKVKIDQQSLKYLLEQRVGTPTQQKWLSKLIGYDFVVEFRAGRENLVVVVLSRQEDTTEKVTLWAISKPLVNWVDQLKDSYKTNSEFQDILQQLDKETIGSLKYYLRGGILYYKQRVYISKFSPIKEAIMNYIHDSLASGHMGFERTLKRARRDFFWVGMKSDIQTYIRHCEVCQRAKGENTKPLGLLQPYLYPPDHGHPYPWIS
jgi:hypothetical protein